MRMRMHVKSPGLHIYPPHEIFQPTATALQHHSIINSLRAFIRTHVAHEGMLNKSDQLDPTPWGITFLYLRNYSDNACAANYLPSHCH